jgi:hypothetical protein
VAQKRRDPFIYSTKQGFYARSPANAGTLSEI